MRLSRFWRSDVSKDIQLLLEKWKEFSTATSAASNAAATLLKLLEETTTMASHSSLSSPGPASVGGAVPSSTSTPINSIKPPALDTPVHVLLGQPCNSVLIWKTLRRHRVPWRETCALAPLQLAVLSDYQREFIQQRSKSHPWRFSRLVLESWEMADPDLLGVFKRLLRCRTVVSLAQEVSAALRGRPHLLQVLPVPSSVLQHLYRLGLEALPSSRECYPAGSLTSASCDALLALNLCKQLALVGRDSLSTATREQLVMDYARLQARSGDWDRALSIVRSSGVVRLSAKVDFSNYVRSRSLWEKANLTARQAPLAVTAAPHWRQALQVLDRFPGNDDVRLEFLSRADVIAAGPNESPSWNECLAIFFKITPEKQTYGVLRKSVLDRLPRESPQFIVDAANALQHVGPRMYSGTFARRLEVLRKKGYWEEAIALACGAKCYDLALSLTPHLTTPIRYVLPVDLISYEEDVLKLQQTCSEGGVSLNVCDSSSKPVTPQVDVSQLTHPQLLVRALYGDWRGILQSSAALSNSRLRSLLAAKRISEDGLNDVGTIECHLFANVELTQLVLSHASARDQQYFLRVVPSAMSTTLRKKLASLSLNAKAVSPLEAYKNFLNSPKKVVTVGDCHALCDLIVQYISAQTTPSSCSRETLLLRELARCAAQGCVQLASSDAYGLALAFLKACKNLKCRPEASTASMAFTSIPSPILDTNFPAMIVGVNALNLSGKWQAVTSVYARWRRKQREGALPDPPPRQHVATHQISDDREQLADVFTRMVYYVPHHQQGEWACRIWREQRNKFSILLQELMVGDTREVSRMLHTIMSLLSCEEKDHHSTGKHLSPRAKEALALEKKKLLGASFCMLHTEAALRYVVRAFGKERVQSDDIDEHGIQRLLKALPGQDAANTILRLHENAETVEDHWLVSVMANPDVTADQLGRLCATRPYSKLAANAFSLASGLLKNNPTAALKSLLRLVIMSESSPSQRFLYAALAKFMQRMCESEVLVSAFKTASNAEENQRLARAVYNRLLESPCFLEKLKHDRKSLTMLLKHPEALSPLLLLGYLHHVLSRFVQHPVKASFSSRMLQLTARHTRDWMTAMYFFKCLRSPTEAERGWVVYAARGCLEAASQLVRSRRFLQGCPEQVVVWSDERLSVDEKWRVSLRLLESAGAGASARKAPLRPSTEGANLARDSAAGAPASWEGIHDKANLTPLDTSEDILQSLIAQWNHLDCVRALELLRRAGFVHRRSEEGEENAKPGPASELCEEMFDDEDELFVVRMIQAQQQRSLKSSNSS